MDAHLLHPQHLGKQCRQPLLGLVAWRDVLLRVYHLRRRQRQPVQLAVGQPRQLLQPLVHGRQHVGRQLRRHLLFQLARARCLPFTRHHIGHQLHVPVHSVTAHHRLGHRGLRPQGRLHLPRIHPVAAHLDLEVLSAQVFQRPVRQPAYHVTGLVQPRARLLAIRVRDEARGRQPRPVPVAARHPHAVYVQLAHHPDRHLPQPPVQHVYLGVGDRCADRHKRSWRHRIRPLVGRVIQFRAAVVVP